MSIEIIIGIIVVILIIIGATQRKAIKLWIRSESKDFVDRHTDDLKMANLKMSDFKDKAEELAEAAANVYAMEESQKTRKDKLLHEYDNLTTKAKASKAQDKLAKAKEYLKLRTEIQNQLTNLDENIIVLIKQREILELSLQKVKTYISKAEIQLQGMNARKETNKLMRSINVKSLNDNGIDSSIDKAENNISSEELKISYRIDNIDEEKEETSAAIEKELEEL